MALPFHRQLVVQLVAIGNASEPVGVGQHLQFGVGLKQFLLGAPTQGDLLLKALVGLLEFPGPLGHHLAHGGVAGPQAADALLQTARHRVETYRHALRFRHLSRGHLVIEIPFRQGFGALHHLGEAGVHPPHRLHPQGSGHPHRPQRDQQIGEGIPAQRSFELRLGHRHHDPPVEAVAIPKGLNPHQLPRAVERQPQLMGHVDRAEIAEAVHQRPG